MSDWVPLTLDNLTNALETVYNWDGLALRLKVGYHRIQEIREEFQTVEQRKRASLQFWLENTPDASWDMVINALKQIHLKGVAKRIETEFRCVQPPEDTSSRDATTTLSEKTRPAPSKSARTKEIRDNVAKLENKFLRLFCKVQADFSKKQSKSPEFLPEFRTSLAMLPVSLKRSHTKFIDEKSSKIAKATTIDELLSILGIYSNYWNHDLITHVITTFGDETLQGELEKYLKDLREFRTTTRLSEFITANTGRLEIPTDFSTLVTEMKADFHICTLEEIEQFRQDMAQRAHVDVIFSHGESGSIVLFWGVPSHAVPLVLEAMDEEFLQSYGIESASIDGIDIRDYPQPDDYDQRSREQQDHGVTVKDPQDLLRASAEGDLDEVVALMKAGVSLDTTDKRGDTALIKASEGGHVHIVTELIRGGANVETREMLGDTVLIKASERGHVHTVAELIRGGANVDTQGVWGWTALINASSGGHTEVVRLLLQSQADVNAHDEDGDTALIKASEEGHVHTVTELIRGGAKVDTRGEGGWTALINASSEGHSEVVRLLLQSQADVDAQDEDGDTALIEASGGGHVHTVTELIRGGAKVDTRGEGGWTALINASSNGHTEVVRLLLQAQADVNALERDGDTALIEASGGGHVHTVTELIRGGANVDTRGSGRQTALFRASYFGRTPVVRELLQAAANVNTQTEEGLTPLIVAVKEGYTELVKILLEAQADPNIQEPSTGWSAVFFSAKEGNLEIVKLLVQYGASVDIVDKGGATAMDVARVNGHNDICLDLQKHIRKQRSKGAEEKHAGSHGVKEEHAGSQGVQEEHAGSQGVQGEHAGSQGVEGELHTESQGGEGEKLHAGSQGKEEGEHTGRGRKPEGKTIQQRVQIMGQRVVALFQKLQERMLGDRAEKARLQGHYSDVKGKKHPRTVQTIMEFVKP